jgi:hypothetical protein
MGAFLAPSLFICQESAVVGLELLDTLDQQVQLGRKGMQVGIFHGIFYSWVNERD